MEIESSSPKIISQPVVLQNWFRLPKNNVSVNRLNELKTHLTIESKKRVFAAQREIPPVKCYQETSSELWIPMRFGLEVIKPKTVVDKRFDPTILKGKELPKFLGKLDEEILQITAKNSCLNDLQTFNQSFLVFPTGEGKTVIFLKLWTDLCALVGRKIPTLFVGNAGDLLTQTEEKINKFLSKNVLVANIGGDQVTPKQKAELIKTVFLYDFALCTIQDLTGKKKAKTNDSLDFEIDEDETWDKPAIKKDDPLDHFKYDSKFFSNFGMIVVDEAHHLGAETWGSILHLCNSKYIFIMTATHTRNDSLDKIMKFWCGEPSYLKLKDYTGKVEVDIYEPRYPEIQDQWTNSYWKGKAEKTYNRPRMFTMLAENDTRNQYMVDKLVAIEKQIPEGGIILCMSQRGAKVPHLATMKRLYEEKAPNVSTAIFTGKQKPSKDILSYRIIWSTFKKMSEYVDISQIACVVFLMPPENESCLIQSLGRGIRLNSRFPVVRVIDFIDNYSFFQRLWGTRFRWYKNENNTINQVDRKPKSQDFMDKIDFNTTKDQWMGHGGRSSAPDTSEKICDF